MRTTIDLDPAILRELKRRQLAEHKTLGQLVSELLAPALSEDRSAAPPDFVWHTADLGLKVDLEDKDALARLLEVGRVGPDE